MKTRVKTKKSVLRLQSSFLSISENELYCILPLHTVSELNCSQHWTERSRRHKRQKKVVYYYISKYFRVLTTPCSIELTRIAPRELDAHDNLPASLKYIVDALCEIITKDDRPGVADSHKDIKILYKQEYSKSYGVKVIITMH